MWRRALTLGLVPLLLVVGACGDDDGASTASASGSGSVATPEGECVVVDGTDADADSELHVSLSEYAIEVEEDGGSTGTVKIEATNDGAVNHEVVVLKAALADLEVGEDGAVIEQGFIGEIEGFAAGTECLGTFEIAEAGTYTLLCAIVEESGESHFGEGMATEIEVG